MGKKEEKFVRELFQSAGIRFAFEGDSAQDVIMYIYNDRLYDAILRRGSLGFGEAYMDEWWDCNNLSELFRLIVEGKLQEKAHSLKTFINLAPEMARSILADCGHWRNSHRVGEHHYDVGNDLYQLMLGPRMVYSCGYWKGVEGLDAAQEHKMRLIGDKLGLKSGMTVLDVGCGFGEALAFFAERYGIRGLGVTISKEQAKFANALCKERGVADRVSVKVQDYREYPGKQFDRAFSVGMFEHVGPKYYRTYFETVRSYLKKDGLFLLHTIGGHASYRTTDPWIDKYIFPGGVIPSYVQMTKAFQAAGFVMEDWHNFGPDYDKTLMAWHHNLLPHWDDLIESKKYDGRFRRMWEYYLLSCAGAFRGRELDLWQIVLSPTGVPGGYTSIR